LQLEVNKQLDLRMRTNCKPIEDELMMWTNLAFKGYNTCTTNYVNSMIVKGRGEDMFFCQIQPLI